jgi:hypothetical protein
MHPSRECCCFETTDTRYPTQQPPENSSISIALNGEVSFLDIQLGAITHTIVAANVTKACNINTIF